MDRDSNPVVYAMSPVGYRTGGPEALHQLVDAVRSFGVESYILPLDTEEPRRPISDYSMYNYEIVSNVAKGNRRLLVLPEVRLSSNLSSLYSIGGFETSHLRLWWLSVNNSRHPEALKFARKLNNPENPFRWGAKSLITPSGARRLKASFHNRKDAGGIKFRLAELERSGLAHLAQSHYAVHFCQRVLGKRAMLVSDYLTPLPEFELHGRHFNRVLFNGSKHEGLVHRIRTQLPHVEFVPLRGMSYSEITSLLASSGAYLELGALPGRDRLPREAARLGLPVILLERGAGHFRSDFPLPEAFVIRSGPGWESRLAERIARTLADFHDAQSSQGEFQAWVLNDRIRFFSEVELWLRAEELM